MTKRLAVASAAALACFAANAQSTVTVFGVMDANVRLMKNGGASVKQLGTDGLVPSRLGFRGTEDLGGGTSAGFWLESGVALDTGNFTGGRFFNRRSTVSLMGRWGELRAGRDFDPTFLNLNTFDPYNGLLFGTPLNLFSTLGSGATTLLRVDNGVQYFLPRDLGGVYGQFAVAAGEGVVGNKYVGGRIGYANGPLNVAVAKGQTTANLNSKFELTNAGASYDLGVVRLMGYVSRSTYRDLKQSHWLLGAVVPVGQGEFRVSYANANASGGATDANDAHQWAAGYVHNLSKRTALYATTGRLTNEGRATFVFATPPAAVIGGRSTGYDIGIRHSF